MYEQRVKFAQWHEDKSALVHPGMRHHKVRFVDDLFAVEQNIQIDGPGAGSIVRVPAKCEFDLPQNGHEALRRDIRLKLDDAVQEPASAWSSMVVHRFCFIEQRHAHDLRVWQQAEQGYCAVAEIDPITDI